MEQLSIFDEIERKNTDSVDDYNNWLRRRNINMDPDDLDVIRILLSKDAWRDEEDRNVQITQYVQNLLEGKFGMYEDKLSDINKFLEWCIEKVQKPFCCIQKNLLETFEICASEMHSMFLGPTEDNIDYLAYLYNLNAPYNQTKPLPYQELKKAFFEVLSNNQ